MKPKRMIIAAVLVLAFDQFTKFVVLRMLDLAMVGERAVWPPYVHFRMAWNRGINFGLFASYSDASRWVLIAVALVIALWVAVWIGRARVGAAAEVSAGLLIGGALGNVVDRLQYGAVADFLNVTCCGLRNPYAFNVADVAIFAGAVGLILFTGQKNPA